MWDVKNVGKMTSLTTIITTNFNESKLVAHMNETEKANEKKSFSENGN